MNKTKTMSMHDLLQEIQDSCLEPDIPVKLLINGVKYNLKYTYEEEFTDSFDTQFVLVAEEYK